MRKPKVEEMNCSLPFLLVLITTRFLSVVNSTTHPDDIQVLRDIKKGFDPRSISPGSCLSSWNFSVDPCDHIFTEWFSCGFRCDIIVSGSYRVTDISLDQAGYNGSISGISFNMLYLQTLDLSYNLISGSIPESFSNLILLYRLSLSSNNFKGSIPSSLGSLSRLQELYLDNNHLTGSIPQSFNELVSLKRLELQQNNLTGEFPDLGQLRNLYYLDLSDNRIFQTGQKSVVLPPSIIEMSLRNNSLKGDLNINLAELRFLQVLDLSYNELTGWISSILFEHPSLQQLTLSHNNFTLLGTPSKMGFTSRLVAADLSHNGLRGLLPAFMAWMPELSALSLEYNKFTGMIPAEYVRKTVIPPKGTASFQRLLLGGNYLFGPIPEQFINLKPGSLNVSLVDNCFYRCPDTLFVCQGAGQKSLSECKNFGPAVP